MDMLGKFLLGSGIPKLEFEFAHWNPGKWCFVQRIGRLFVSIEKVFIESK